MVSEAQKREAAKYQRESTKRKALTFYKSEVDILEPLQLGATSIRSIFFRLMPRLSVFPTVTKLIA